jgi:hypothetical protein
MLCRGLVVDENYNIITEPLPKIFNYGIEAKAPRISGEEVVLAVKKVNGFFCAVSQYKNEMLISTTGSLDSEFCDMARYMINTLDQDYINERLDNGDTLFFEIVHENDPHIIKEQVGAYYLAHRNDGRLYTKIDNRMEDAGIIIPYSYISKFKTIKENVKHIKHEGYVIYSKNGDMTKIKSPYYLVSKLLARCNNLEELMKGNIKNRVDEEYFGLIDHVKEDMKNFSCISEQDRLQYIRTFFEEVLV